MTINTGHHVEQATQGVLEYVQAPFIELQDLCKVYGTKTAVDHINLSVFGGEVFGFLGPNGAGKTTTIKMMVGLLQPTSGTVKITGYDIQEQPLQAKISSGYVPDTPTLYSKLSARELLRFVGDLHCMNPRQISHRIEDLLSMFNLIEAGGLALGAGNSVVNRTPLDQLGWRGNSIRASLELSAGSLASGNPIPEEAMRLMAKRRISKWMFFLLGPISWLLKARKYGTVHWLWRRPYLIENKMEKGCV
jgi:ABC-type glutathione transport system ATPase component